MKINMNWIKTRNNVSVILYAYCDLFCSFRLLVSLWKCKKNMLSVIFNKSTESNVPPQVLLSIYEANGPELWKTLHVLFAV